MSITSYSELKDAVASWLARDDLTSRIPDFITLAEAKFNRNLSVRQMEQRSVTTIDTGSDSPEFISLPTNFQSMRWLRLQSVNGKPHLNYLSPVALDEARTRFGNVAAQPIYFTVLASDIELCPTPDSNYTLEMVYLTLIPALSDTNTTNWLLAFAPDAYLYGALLEASAYMQNDERVPLWLNGYQMAMNELTSLNRRSSFGAGPLVMRVSGATP